MSAITLSPHWSKIDDSGLHFATLMHQFVLKEVNIYSSDFRVIYLQAEKVNPKADRHTLVPCLLNFEEKYQLALVDGKTWAVKIH